MKKILGVLTPPPQFLPSTKNFPTIIFSLFQPWYISSVSSHGKGEEAANGNVKEKNKKKNSFVLQFLWCLRFPQFLHLWRAICKKKMIIRNTGAKIHALHFPFSQLFFPTVLSNTHTHTHIYKKKLKNK